MTSDQQLRQAVLLIFCDPVPAECLRLSSLSARDWHRLLHWLDTSGLALYFLDRIVDLQLWTSIPPSVLSRLQQNLRDNTDRMRRLIAESLVVQQEFQRTGISYATLKGFSLWPHSVPKLELRSQLDLDFLVAEKDIPAARQILERHGYHLHAVSGRSWEFKTDHVPTGSLDDLYKYVPHRCVELHAEANIPGQRSLLVSAVQQDFHGIRMPILSPADLFLGQGMHLFKHVCSEYSRTAHLLEFRRHVLARRGDPAFWEEVRSIASTDRRAPLSLGIVTLLITRAMGDFAPELLANWTVARLPLAARGWIELYGHYSVFTGFPGTKLYLFLQRELQSSRGAAKRTLRRALVPLRLPPSFSRPTANETLRIRVRRYRLQLKFIMVRLRFHAREGVRYTGESFRWRRYMSRLTRDNISGASRDVPLLPVSASLSLTTKE